MKQYLELLEDVLKNGEEREDRTGVGTIGVFGRQVRYDLSKGFPLVTTKKIHLKSVIHELLWFLSGNTNVKYLQDNGVSIWNEWATEEQCAKFGRKAGDLGRIYGAQWRNFGASKTLIEDTRDEYYYNNDGVDQIKNLVHGLKNNPASRRHIVTGWNPKEADQVALPPCHTLFQLYVSPSKKLSCNLYQRSLDLFLGNCFNVASYSLLIMMLAQVTDLIPGEFIHSIGDAHIYKNHIEQVKLQLSREPKNLPLLILNPDVKDIFQFKYEDFKLENYNYHPAIKAPIAV